MIRLSVILVCLVCVLPVSNAQKYITKSGLTQFEASVETFEEIRAENNSTTAIIDVSTGEVASLLFVNAFDFRLALMQEHFNENYMESDDHPKATFKGKILGFDVDKLGSEAEEMDLQGILTIRDISKEIDSKVSLSRQGSVIKAMGSFVVKPEEFDISIPGVVRNKIAQEVNINYSYELQEK